MNFGNTQPNYNWGQNSQQSYGSLGNFGYNYSNYGTQNQTPIYSIKWAEGKESAKSFELPPNSQVILLDSKNDDTMYIRTTDALGRYNTMFFKITQVSEEELDNNSNKKLDPSLFVTREEFEQLLKKIEGGLGGQTDESTVSTTKPLTTISSLSGKRTT